MMYCIRMTIPENQQAEIRGILEPRSEFTGHGVLSAWIVSASPATSIEVFDGEKTSSEAVEIIEDFEDAYETDDEVIAENEIIEIDSLDELTLLLMKS